MLTETASTISFYGVNDLKDVLLLVRRNGCSSLEKCRSQRVMCYIRVGIALFHLKILASTSILKNSAPRDFSPYFWNYN